MPKLAKSLLLLVIMGTLVLSACGKKEEVKDDTPVETAPADKTMKLSGYRFNPTTLSIPVGTKVTFKNEDPEVHNVRIASLNVDQNVEPGKSWSYTFDTAGEYAVDNRLATNPMTATITVK
jgi:plastocyanin